MRTTHLQEELTRNSSRVSVETCHGFITGGVADNGALVFLEVPYALPPDRFEDPKPLPNGFRYDEKEYIREATYGVQPSNDGQASGKPFEDKVGLGKPSENPLFLNIHIPPSFPTRKNFPVRVYIHGGFLQFGSPHSLGSQAQYVTAERSEIWINVGYRLSAFGFLACDEPRLTGNYGFKDQWLALEWIKSNISAFGGNPDDIRLTGLSAGAHSVHQLLHHASQLPEGKRAPFNSAVLQSNAILNDPKTPVELRLQFQALCRALHLDPESSDVLTSLKDTEKVPWSAITQVIESDILGPLGTFRGCLSGDWLFTSPGPMEWQRSGDFARGLRSHGVQYIVLGDLTEEWYLYSIAHPIRSPSDIVPNLERYFPLKVVQKLIQNHPPLPLNAGKKESQRLYGDILSCGQVHLPVRILARDLRAAGFPVLRYEIRWTPEQARPFGYVTHGEDRLIWALRLPNLYPKQVVVAKAWLQAIEEQVHRIQTGDFPHGLEEVLALKEDKMIAWKKDERWEEVMQFEEILKHNKHVGKVRSRL